MRPRSASCAQRLGATRQQQRGVGLPARVLCEAGQSGATACLGAHKVHGGAAQASQGGSYFFA